jgi:hypothetical protein
MSDIIEGIKTLILKVGDYLFAPKIEASKAKSKTSYKPCVTKRKIAKKK